LQVDLDLVMQCVSTLSGAERCLAQRLDVLLSAAAQHMGAQMASVSAVRRLKDCVANGVQRASAALKALELVRAAAAAGPAAGGGQAGALGGRALLEACDDAFASLASNLVSLWGALVEALPHMAVGCMRFLEDASRLLLHPSRPLTSPPLRHDS